MSSESLDTSVGTANMVGIVLSTMTYGVHLALFAQLNRLYFGLVGSRQARRRSNRDWRLLVYVYFLFLLSTTGLCLQTWINHDAFIIHGAFPGGPLAYLAQQTCHPAHLVMVIIYVILNWSADGMLLYRAYVLSKYSKYVSAICTFAVVALIGVGSYFIQTVGATGIHIWTEGELGPSLGYLSLMFSINIVFTVGTVWRLLYIRQELGTLLGPEAARTYTSIAAMVVESASLYTVVTLLSIVACAKEIPMQNALLPMLGQLQAIPPLMIIVRVMEGRAVTAETWSTSLPITFRANQAPPLPRVSSLASSVSFEILDSKSSFLTPYSTCFPVQFNDAETRADSFGSNPSEHSVVREKKPIGLQVDTSGQACPRSEDGSASTATAVDGTEHCKYAYDLEFASLESTGVPPISLSGKAACPPCPPSWLPSLQSPFDAHSPQWRTSPTLQPWMRGTDTSAASPVDRMSNFAAAVDCRGPWGPFQDAVFAEAPSPAVHPPVPDNARVRPP